MYLGLSDTVLFPAVSVIMAAGLLVILVTGLPASDRGTMLIIRCTRSQSPPACPFLGLDKAPQHGSEQTGVQVRRASLHRRRRVQRDGNLTDLMMALDSTFVKPPQPS